MVLVGQSALRGHQITGKGEFLDDWDYSSSKRLKHEATLASFFSRKVDLPGGHKVAREKDKVGVIVSDLALSDVLRVKWKREMLRIRISYASS